LLEIKIQLERGYNQGYGSSFYWQLKEFEVEAKKKGVKNG
jgi:hypothetical protein